MRFGAIANSARGGPQRPPPMGDRVKLLCELLYLCFLLVFNNYAISCVFCCWKPIEKGREKISDGS